MLQKLNKEQEEEVKSVSLCNNLNKVKLPKLELPSFSNDVLELQAFWDQFNDSVDSSDLSDSTKFAYLKSLLKGDTWASIDGLSVTHTNYSNACDLLHR